MQRPTTTMVACLKALTLLPLLFSTVPGAHAQLTSNVLRRVLMIQAGESAGTGFTIDVDGRQYLITAKHVVSSLKPEDTILVRKGDDWDRVTVKIFRCDDPIDIAVLVPPSQLTVSFPLEPTMAGLRYGQDMYFAGFPYGLLFMDGKNVNGLYPIAFVKKAIMSASTNVKGANVIFLDGHNNPGFSGGPIVYRDLDRRDFVYKLAGVVSGYRPELIPVVSPEEIEPGEDTTREEQWRIVKLKSGHLVKLKDTDQMVPTNSGIVIGYSITHAVELIRKHPNRTEGRRVGKRGGLDSFWFPVSPGAHKSAHSVWSDERFVPDLCQNTSIESPSNCLKHWSGTSPESLRRNHMFSAH